MPSGLSSAPLRVTLVMAASWVFAIAPAQQTLRAQQGSLVDRIAAVVGDSVITLTQVQERIFQLSSQGIEIPTDPAARARLQRDVLDQIIGEQLIVQAAIRDSTITVDDTDLEEMVSQDLLNRARQYPGGQTAFQAALEGQGWTLASYREFLRGQVRQQRLYQQYMGKRSRDLAGIMIEESEVEAFFQSQKGNLGQRPPSVSFNQIIISSSPSDSAKAAARGEAERIRQLAVSGGDFEDLARQFSEEPGAKESGGDLGWFRRGEMVKEFEEAAFNMAVNEISPVVETTFGFHIIKVERRRSGEVKARHILIQAEPTESDIALAGERAETVAARLRSAEDFTSLRREFGDSLAPDSLEYAFDELSQLPPGFSEPLLDSEAGQVIGPLSYVAQGLTRYAVIRVREVKDGGEYSLEELRTQIRARLQEEKLLENILAELRSRTYVQIRI